jgi:hypothetical protein
MLADVLMHAENRSIDQICARMSLSVWAQSPSETLLYEVHCPKLLKISNRLSNVIRQSTWSTDSDAHGSCLLIDLILQQEIDVWSAGEHVNCVAGGGDLSWVLRSCDKKLDDETISSAFHLENFIHPRSDPFQMLAISYNPD